MNQTLRKRKPKQKSNKELANKIFGTKGTKCNKDGTPKVTKTNKTQCKHFGKKHKGKCWKLESSKSNKSTWQSGGKPFNKKQMNFMNKMFESHSLTKANSSDSDSEDTGTTG